MSTNGGRSPDSEIMVGPDREKLSAATLQEKAANGSFWTLIHVATSVPIAFVANALVARALGVESYGALAFLMLVLSIATPLVNAGVNEGVLQWGAAAHSMRDSLGVQRLLRKATGYHVLIQLPALTLVVVLATMSSPIWVTAVAVAGTGISTFLGPAVLANSIENKSAASARIAMASNVAVQATVSSVALVTHSPAAVWASRSLATAATLPLNLRLVNPAWRRSVTVPGLPLKFPTGFWRFSLYTSLSLLIGLLVFSRTELVLLNWSGLTTAAGLFALAFGLAQQICAPIDAVLGPLSPAVTGIVEAHPDRAGETLLRAIRITGLLGTCVCVVGFPLVIAFIPWVYGSAFGGASAAFLVLAISSCLQSVINPLLTFNRARRRSDLLLKINLAALALDLTLAILAIPRLGLWGAVIANASAQVLVLLLLAVTECRAWSVSASQLLSAMTPFLAAITAVLAFEGVALNNSWPTFYSCPLIIVLTTIIVVFAARALGGTIPAADVRPGLAALPAPIANVARLLLRPVVRD